MKQQRTESNYSEWVLPQITSFLPTLGIYPTIWLTFLPIAETLGVIIGVTLTALVIAAMFLKAPRIEIKSGTLSVGSAQIETRFISSVTVIDEKQAFAERGRNLHALAHIHFQGSVKTLVRIEIDDKDDPTPYWLFSTRNPVGVQKALGY